MQATAVGMVFVCASVFVLYVLAGYPLLLWMLARRRPKPVYKSFEPKTVSILIPVHNGDKWIRQKLESILALDYPADLLEIFVLSDGSTDATEAISLEFADRGVQTVHLLKGGKAVALNKGLELARGEIVFFNDVRQSLEQDCLRSLVSCFADPMVGAVCGELIIHSGETLEEESVGLYWRLEKWIRRQLSSMGTLLVVTGCVYAVRRKLAEPLPAGTLGDDIFVPQSVLRKGYRVIFEEGAKAYDFPTTHDLEFRRKVRTLAGLYQYIGKHGLGSYWFHFFSYKVSRLLLPYAVAIAGVTSFFLPAPYAALTVTAQALFYGLAFVDKWLPDHFPLKRLSSPARTFCMLMLASVQAISVLVIPASELWKTTHVRQPKASGDQA